MKRVVLLFAAVIILAGCPDKNTTDGKNGPGWKAPQQKVAMPEGPEGPLMVMGMLAIVGAIILSPIKSKEN